jgi:hypothetical protein
MKQRKELRGLTRQSGAVVDSKELVAAAGTNCGGGGAGCGSTRRAPGGAAAGAGLAAGAGSVGRGVDDVEGMGVDAALETSGNGGSGCGKTCAGGCMAEGAVSSSEAEMNWGAKFVKVNTFRPNWYK